LAGFINTPASERRAASPAARQPLAEPKGPQPTRSVAGIAAGGATGTPRPHIASVQGMFLSRPFRRVIANIAAFSPLEFGAFLGRPKVTETKPQRIEPTPPPAAEPRPPTVRPPDRDEPAIAPVAKWTEADVTEHPDLEAAPATESAGPSKLAGKLKGFRSRREWRWAFASKQPFAHRKAEASKGGPKVRYRVLPERKVSPR
jgi:hypothetical protein